MSTTDDTTSRELFPRSPNSSIEASDQFRAAPPMALPRRRLAPPRRPSRLLPPASSRGVHAPLPAPASWWADRIWIPAVVAGAIMIAAIGFSLHADWIASHDATARAESHARTSPAPAQGSEVVAAPPRAGHAGTAVPASDPTAVAPKTVAPSDVRGLAAAPSTLERSPPAALAPPPVVVERIAVPTKQASAAILAPPPIIDQPVAPRFIDPAANADTPVSMPRPPVEPPATTTPPSPLESVATPPPRAVSAASATRIAPQPPKVRASSRRTVVTKAKSASPEADPDAPPRTWQGMLHRQLIRSAP